MPRIEDVLRLTPHYKRRAEAYKAEHGEWPEWYAAFKPLAVPAPARTRAARIASGETVPGTSDTQPTTNAARLVQKETKRAKNDKYEIAMYQAIAHAGLPLPMRQFRYIPGRKFAADFAYPTRRVLIEIQGGIFSKEGGGHNRGAGYEADRAKYAEAQLLGWRVFEFGPKAVDSGDALKTIERILATFPEQTTENQS